jgi:hypothetical protein
LRILIASANLKKAKGFLEAIKSQIEFNPEFIARFGQLKDSAKWTQDAINIKGHTHGDKEASISVASIGTDMTSQHYDLIILDDVINREFAATEEQRQKCVDLYMDCLDLLEPDGRIVLVGTRWHFDDIYSMLIMQNNKNPIFKFVVDEPMMTNPKYTRREYKQMIDDPETTYLFPEKFTPKVTKKLYLEKVSKPNGGYEFSCQQMNFPVSDEKAPFKIEEFRFVKSVPPSCVDYMTVDPAGAEKVSKGQDDAAMVVTSMDVNLDLYNKDVFSEQVTSAGFFKALSDMVTKHPTCRKIGMEKNFNNANKVYIDENFPGIAMKLITFIASNTANRKAMDIMALQPYVSNGKFYFVEHEDGIEYSIGERVVKLTPGQHKLLMQLIDYGSTKHDDAADAQSAVLKFIRKPRPVLAQSVQVFKPTNKRTGY